MTRRGVSLVAALVLALGLGGGAVFLAVGCGDDGPKPETAAKAPAPAPVPAPAPARAPEAAPAAEENVPTTPVNLQAGATISGTVQVANPPRRKRIKMEADPKCAALHAETPLADDIVADANGNVQFAFVYVKKGLEGKKFAAPTTPARIDQKGCRYEPHVFGIMVGQELEILNSDELLHNIHALPLLNKEFNFGQPQKGMTEKRTFSTPEVMVKFKCDIHPWMGAWMGVLTHPFHATTDAAGKYAIKGLPAGKYTVEIWHELYKSVAQEVEVKESETKTLDVRMADLKGQ